MAGREGREGRSDVWTYNFRKVHRCDNDSLTNTESSDETTSVDSTERTVVTHENSHTDDPKDTELTSGPDTTDAITDQEGAVDKV
jgi:hypothetical protein